MTDHKQDFGQIFGPAIGLIDRLTGWGSLLSALCLLGILVLMMMEIVARNLFGSSFDFTWDIAGYLMGACFTLALAGAMKNGLHVRVTALLDALPARAAHLIEMAACLVAVAICAVIATAFVQLAWLSWTRDTTSATAIRVPLVYPQAVLAAGTVLMTLQCIAQALRLLRGERLSVAEAIE